MTTPTRAAALALAAVLLLLAACSWAVPADPGLNAKLRRPRTSGAAGAAGAPGAPNPAGSVVAEADEGARRLYLNHCGRCHEPFAPEALRAVDWPRFVRRFGPRAGLFGADRARVLAWLQAHAR